MAETIGLVTLTYVGDIDLSRPAFLSHQCQASECPLRKNSRARALASSHRSSLVRLSSRPLNQADSSSEVTMRAFPAGSNAMAAEERHRKLGLFLFSNLRYLHREGIACCLTADSESFDTGRLIRHKVCRENDQTEEKALQLSLIHISEPTRP